MNLEELAKQPKATLIQYAQDNSIDLCGAKTKNDILDAIKNHAEAQGGNEMEENTVVEEVVETVEGEEVDTTLPEGAEATAVEKVFEVDGKEVTKSEFIRHQFLNNNLSRKEISEQFDIEYRTVYGATVNMTNDAAPTSRGRSASQAKIAVTEDNIVVTTQTKDMIDEATGEVTGEGIVVYFNNEEQPEGTEIPATVETDRNAWIKVQVDAGVDRADIAKALGLSYGVIYNITKGQAGTKEKIMMDYEGESVSRSEYIRRKFAAGMSKADIAKELGVEYSVVWSATKAEKTEEEKYQDAVTKLAKFTADVEDAEAFNALLESLKAVTFKVEEEASEEVSEDAVDEAVAEEVAEETEA